MRISYSGFFFQKNSKNMRISYSGFLGFFPKKNSISRKKLQITAGNDTE